MSEAPEPPAGRAVVVGASSGVGRALAEELARRGWQLVISARETRDLEALASDLALRHGTRIHCRTIDLGAADFDARAYRDACGELLGDVDAVLVTAGMVDPRDRGPGEPETTARLIRVNYESVIQVVARFAEVFEARDGGTIVTFSSIAAAAPRRQNTVYSSAKAALETYCRGLRHHLSPTRVILQTYALGYVDTAMSFGLKLLFPVASPAWVARYVADHLHRDRGRIYLPRFWAIVVLALRSLPWFIYKRLSF